MSMIHYRLDSAYVATSLRHEAPVAFLTEACGKDAAIVLDEVRPEQPTVADRLLEVSDATDPRVDIDALAVIPELQFGNQFGKCL